VRRELVTPAAKIVAEQFGERVIRELRLLQADDVRPPLVEPRQQPGHPLLDESTFHVATRIAPSLWRAVAAVSLVVLPDEPPGFGSTRVHGGLVGVRGWGGGRGGAGLGGTGLLSGMRLLLLGVRVID
jgi:hypothetical protein